MREMQVQPNKEEYASCPPKAPAKPETFFDLLKGAVCALVLGFVFGFVFEKSRVFEVPSIRGQMIFSRWVMLKMFMGAAGTSAFCLAAASKFIPEHMAIVRGKYRTSCERSLVFGLCLGAVLLGVGMTVSSACPGMVLSQVGAGMPNAGVTVAGCFAGAVVYSLVERTIRENFIKRGFIIPSDKRFVDELLGLSPSTAIKLQVVVGIVCWCAVIPMELLSPWQSDREVS